MKILYIIGQRYGASYQALRILPQLKDHQVQVFGYANYSEFQGTLNLTLDALKFTKANYRFKELRKILPTERLIRFDYLNLQFLLEYLESWQPDLIIIDYDHTMAYIAEILKIEWWSVTPLHLFDCFERVPYGSERYFGSLEAVNQFLQPKVFCYPKRKLIYSPFGDLTACPSIKKGFEWLRPYYQKELKLQSSIIEDSNLCLLPKERFILKKYLPQLQYLDYHSNKYHKQFLESQYHLNLGQTDLLADIIYHQHLFSIAPSLKDPESLVNANLIRSYRLAPDLGQIELMENQAQRSYLQATYQLMHYDLDLKKNIKQLHKLF